MVQKKQAIKERPVADRKQNSLEILIVLKFQSNYHGALECYLPYTRLSAELYLNILYHIPTMVTMRKTLQTLAWDHYLYSFPFAK